MPGTSSFCGLGGVPVFNCFKLFEYHFKIQGLLGFQPIVTYAFETRLGRLGPAGAENQEQ